MDPGIASRIRRRSVAWAIVSVALAIGIFVLSAQPNLRFVSDDGWDVVVRKTGHVLIFGLLAVSVWGAVTETTGVSRPALLALVVTALYAVTDEVHQSFTAGRHPSPGDLGFDIAGAALGLALAAWLVRRSRRSGG